MFERLSERLQLVFDKLRKKGKLTEEDVTGALREVRLALLEADVHYKVVKEFLEKVKERAVGQEVMRSLTPAQQVIKIVKEELISLMGGDTALNLKGNPAILMLIGLQGSGKTTTAAKLGLKFKREGYKPALLSLDARRPAAFEQLEKLAEKIGVICFKGSSDPFELFENVKKEASQKGFSPLIVDTAGTLHIERELMEELRKLKERIKPNEVLLVVDSMTGQDALNVAQGFEEAVGITGIILTKLDGDARGGAALSIKAVTGKPIKLIGVGEGLEALEPFYPDRIVSRILGMGDVLTLIEKTQRVIEEEEAKRLEQKLREDRFDFEDFRQYLRMLRKMGNLESLLKLIPGLPKVLKDEVKVDYNKIRRMEAIINSMTIEERRKPHIINASRKRRIARGSGTTIQEVNQLLRQFEMVRKLLREMKTMRRKKWFGVFQ
jgi:signal recognition particle subunit SRP54